MATLTALFKQYPFRSAKKFIPVALEKGFSKRQAMKFLNSLAHDKQFSRQSEYFLPIYSQGMDSYQFDTLIQKPGSDPPYFLVFINVNSRKGYAYPMSTKGTKDVIEALTDFINLTHPKELTSDQDSAYLANEVMALMHKHNIDYRTTEDNNHNVLGIINRFMRTLRDWNHEPTFTRESMRRLLIAYNGTKHGGTGVAPNNFTKRDNDKYIVSKDTAKYETLNRKDFMLAPGTKVKIMMEHSPLEKRRSNLSNDHYLVVKMEGNGVLIRAADNSTAFYPRHKVVVDGSGELAKTLDDGKRGIVDKIISYNEKKDKYKVAYEGGVTDTIPSRNLRETHPTALSLMEKKYWRTRKIPNKLIPYAR